MLRACALAAVLFVSSATFAEATSVPAGGVVAQYSNQREEESSGSTRTRTRGTGKLIGAGIAGVFLVGGFIYRKVRGQ